MLARIPTTPAGSCTVSAATALAALRWRLFDVPWGSWNREELPYRRSEPFGEAFLPTGVSNLSIAPSSNFAGQKAGRSVRHLVPALLSNRLRRSVLFCFMFHPSPKQRSRFLGSFISIPWFRRSPLLPPLGSTADPLSFVSEFPLLPHAPVTRVGWAILFLFPFQPPLLLPSSKLVLHNNNNTHTTTAARELKTASRLTDRVPPESCRNLNLRDIHEISPIPHLALQRRRIRKARSCRRIQAATRTGDSSTIQCQITHTRASSQST